MEKKNIDWCNLGVGYLSRLFLLGVLATALGDFDALSRNWAAMNDKKGLLFYAEKREIWSKYTAG